MKIKMLSLAAVFLNLIIALSAASDAEAHDCKIETYDRTDPKAIVGTVSDMVAKFSWMADVDVEGEQSWSCNCIQNLASDGWSGSWEKAGINVHIARPLQPGAQICKQEFLGKHRKDADLDAPIHYGSINAIQKAAVFVSDLDSKQSFGEESSSVDLSSIQNDAFGNPLSIKVSASLINKIGEGYRLSFNAPEGYSVGLVGGANGWNDSLGKSILSSNRQATEITDIYLWSGVAKADETDFIPPNEYIILPARFSTTLSTESVVGQGVRPVEFVLFGPDRKPILRSSVKLPASR